MKKLGFILLLVSLFLVGCTSPSKENSDPSATTDKSSIRQTSSAEKSSTQKSASSWLVEQSLKYVLEHGYSFILEDTFAILSAEKNIIRALKNNFRVTIFYVYQDPKVAWDFTRKHELAEGRHVPKEMFINAFFKSRENIEKVKNRHPEVVLHIMIKDYQNDISEVHYAADNIQLVLPNTIYFKRVGGGIT